MASKVVGTIFYRDNMLLARLLKSRKTEAAGKKAADEQAVTIRRSEPKPTMKNVFLDWKMSD